MKKPTNPFPQKAIALMQSFKCEFERKQKSGRRHISATAGKEASGGKAFSLKVYATSKAEAAILWLDAGFIGTADYMGMAWFWSYEYRHLLRGATYRQRQRAHAGLLKAGLSIDGDSEQHLEIIENAVR
jgi:hypothetical protein